MKLKNATNFGGWVFYIGGKSESDNPSLEIEQIRVPSHGFAKSRSQLESMVMKELSNLNAQGVNGYWESIKTEAASYGKKPLVFLSELIEHQICVNFGLSKNKLCWNITLGDKIHNVVAVGVDNLMEKAPEPIKKVWKRVVKLATPKAFMPGRISSCGGCGGSKSLKISKNNRGRAGRI